MADIYQFKKPGNIPGQASDYHSPYDFQDIRTYLRAVFTKLSKEDSQFSIRTLSKKAGFSSNGYLSKVLDGKRGLTAKALFALAEVLEIPTEYLTYLELLRATTEARSSEARAAAMKRLQSFQAYKKVGGFTAVSAPSEDDLAAQQSRQLTHELGFIEELKNSFRETLPTDRFFVGQTFQVQASEVKRLRQILSLAFERIDNHVKSLPASSQESSSVKVTLCVVPVSQRKKAAA